MIRGRIVGTGRAVPPKVLTNDDLAKMVDTSDAWIVERTGIRERRWVDEGSPVGSSDLGVEAAKKIRDAYTAERYHQPADHWEADWPLTGIARDLQILYTLGNDLANSESWPNWGQDSEFRAARDGSADARK